MPDLDLGEAALQPIIQSRPGLGFETGGNGIGGGLRHVRVIERRRALEYQHNNIPGDVQHDPLLGADTPFPGEDRHTWPCQLRLGRLERRI
ncbi:MAG: hypothetical protein ACRDJ4_09820 [Actinomycetota bacterium]